MAYILALVQGTTSSRAILFEQEDKVAGIAQHTFKQVSESAGSAEQDHAIAEAGAAQF
jgi:glycerol kinase